MQFWLIKSEPFVFSYDQLERDGRAIWDGVRNYAARNNLRAMKIGDVCLFYHSNEGLEVVGLAKVIQEYFPDPTAESGDWSAVEVAPMMRLNQGVSLKTIKAHPELQNMAIIKLSRLSVTPVTKSEFDVILNLGDTSLAF